MKVIRVFCDRCGKETTASCNRHVSFSKSAVYSQNVTMDLCKDCHGALLDFMYNDGEKKND